MSTQGSPGSESAEPPPEVSRDAPYLAGVTPTMDDGADIGPIAVASGDKQVVPLDDVPELADDAPATPGPASGRASGEVSR